MRNIIRIGAGTDRRNRFVAIALGVALAVGPAAMLPAAALAAPATDAAAASTTAGATITLQGADGASLAGHTFDVYRIGTYTDQILNGTQISSLGVRGDTASNAWAADAIGIANAYDPDTAMAGPVPPRSPRPARAPALPSPWPDYSPWPGPPCSRPWPAPAAMARTLTVSRPTDEAILRPAHAPAEALYDNGGTVWASWTSSSALHPSAFSRPASRPATAFRCACAPCYFLIPGCTNLDRSRPATA